MRIQVQHPVPVLVGRRGGAGRVAYHALRTGVEIPEVPAGTFQGDGERLVMGGGNDFLVHEGRAWRRVTRLDLGRPIEGWKSAPLADVMRHLGRRRGRCTGWLVRSPGPLAGRARMPGSPDPNGADLSRKLLGDGMEAAVEGARAALHALAARGLRTDGERLYVSAPLPILLPLTRDGTAGPLPDTLGDGPAFPFGEADAARAFTDAVRAVRTDPWTDTLPDPPPGLGDPDGESRRAILGLVVADGPAEVAGIVAALRERCAAAGTMPSPALDAGMEALSPYVMPGLVGAIPEAQWPDACRRMLDVLDAAAGAVPAGYRPVRLAWMRPYLRGAVIPWLGTLGIP